LGGPTHPPGILTNNRGFTQEALIDFHLGFDFDSIRVGDCPSTIGFDALGDARDTGARDDDALRNTGPTDRSRDLGSSDCSRVFERLFERHWFEGLFERLWFERLFETQ